MRKGEKAALVVFYKQYEAEPSDEHDDSMRRVAKASWVFNVAQVEGYAADKQLPPLPPLDRLFRAEQLIKATGADIRVGATWPTTAHLPITSRCPTSICSALKATSARRIGTPF